MSFLRLALKLHLTGDPNQDNIIKTRPHMGL